MNTNPAPSNNRPLERIDPGESFVLDTPPQKSLAVGDIAIHLTGPYADGREDGRDGSGRDTQIPFGHVVTVTDVSQNTPDKTIWWSQVQRGDGPDKLFVENHRLHPVHPGMLADLRSTTVTPYVWGRIEIEPVEMPEHLRGSDKMVLGLGCRLPLFGLDGSGTFLGRDGVYRIRRSLVEDEAIPVGQLEKTAANFIRVFKANTGGSFGYGGMDAASADCSGQFVASNAVFGITDLPHGSLGIYKQLLARNVMQIPWSEARTGDAVFVSRGPSDPQKVGFVYQVVELDGQKYAWRSKQNIGLEVPLADGRLRSLGEDRTVLGVFSMGFA